VVSIAADAAVAVVTIEVDEEDKAPRDEAAAHNKDKKGLRKRIS
jgi:hypothetical protein